MAGLRLGVGLGVAASTPIIRHLSVRQYLDYTRSPWYSFLFALPLLVLYQVCSVLANVGQDRAVINGADGLLHSVLRGVGLPGWLVSWLALTAVVGVVVYRVDRAHSGQKLEARYFPLLLAESAVYALAFGSVVGFLASFLLPGQRWLALGGSSVSFGQKLATSLGAGLYEELVFRLLVTGGLIWLFRRFRLKEGPAAAPAVLASSVVFSLFHYIGPLGDPFGLTRVCLVKARLDG